jgi:hypothetical protein
LILCGSLAACGGNDTKEVDCEASLQYQNRVEGKRVIAPEGLDALNEMVEMPIPRADPSAPRMPAGVCNDFPPVIQVSED